MGSTPTTLHINMRNDTTGITGAASAPRTDADLPTAGSTDRRARREDRRPRPLIWVTTADIHAEREPTLHGLRIAWTATASAVAFGALLGGGEWQFAHSPFFTRYLTVDALIAFVLTPLVVSLYLTLPKLATRLFWRLKRDKVIDPAAAKRFAKDLRQQFERVYRLVAAPAALYFVSAVYFGREKLTSPLMTLLVVAALVLQAVIFTSGS